MKKPYSKPELILITPGTPKHNEIIALLNAQEKTKQMDSKAKEQRYGGEQIAEAGLF